MARNVEQSQPLRLLETNLDRLQSRSQESVYSVRTILESEHDYDERGTSKLRFTHQNDFILLIFRLL